MEQTLEGRTVFAEPCAARAIDVRWMAA